MAKAIAMNMRNGFMTVVEKPSLSEAVDQLYNVMRLNGWTGTREEIVPDREVRHGIFAYRVESSSEDELVHVGWFCWRAGGHLAEMACRSDCVPIHVPKEWEKDFREYLRKLEDEPDE